MVASLNASENDIPEQFLPRRFEASLPRLTMFARNKKDYPIHFQESYNHSNILNFIDKNIHATFDVETLLTRSNSLEEKYLDEKEAQELLEERRRLLNFLEQKLDRDTEEHVDDCDMFGELEVSSRRAVFEIEAILKSSKQDLQNLLTLPVNCDPHPNVWRTHSSTNTWIRHLRVVCEDLRKLESKFTEIDPVTYIKERKDFLKMEKRLKSEHDNRLFVVAYLCEEWDVGSKLVAKEIKSMASRFQDNLMMMVDATQLRSELTYVGIWTVPTVRIIRNGAEIKRFEGPEIVGMRHFVEDLRENK